MLEVDVHFQYLLTIIHGEAWRQFDSLYADVKIEENLDVDYIIRGLSQYPPPLNSLSKKKRAMRC